MKLSTTLALVHGVIFMGLMCAHLIFNSSVTAGIATGYGAVAVFGILLAMARER